MNEKEKVLVVPSNAVDFEGIINYSAEKFQKMLKKSKWMDRDEAEEDTNWKQVIPCAVLTTDGLIGSYNRTDESTESRLRNKPTVLFGGHMNPCDGSADRCLARELKEELGIDIDKNVIPILMVNYCNSPVSSVHLGIVYLLKVDNNIRLKEHTMYDLSFGVLDDILFMDMDEWSNGVLQKLKSDTVKAEFNEIRDKMARMTSVLDKVINILELHIEQPKDRGYLN